MVCSSKTSFSLSFEQIGSNDPVQCRLVKRPLFLFLLKKRVPHSVRFWSSECACRRVLCACSILSGCLASRGYNDVDCSWWCHWSIHNLMLRIDTLCRSLTICYVRNNVSEIGIDSLSFGLSPGKLSCMYFDWFFVSSISLSAANCLRLSLRTSPIGVWAI